MTHSKVDLAIKGTIAALLVALGFVIVWSMQEHIAGVGDTAPNFTITTTAGRDCDSAEFRRQGSGPEFLGELVCAVRGGGAVAQRIRENIEGLGRRGAGRERRSE